MRLGIGIVCCVLSAALTARAADLTEAQRRASSAALEVMQRTGFLQIPVDRAAVAETSLDEATKKKLDDTFVGLEADLRPLVTSVQTDPSSIDDAVFQGRQFAQKALSAVRQAVSDDQYKGLVQRTRLVQVQLMAISAGPAAFARAASELRLTPEQRKKMDALLTETAAQVRHLTDSLMNQDRVVPSAEQLVRVTLDARKRLRAIFTDDQRKTLDDNTNLEPPKSDGLQLRPGRGRQR